MEIVPIFDKRLYSIQIKGESQDELSRFLELWDDTEYLYDFYEKNKTYFEDYFFTTQRNKHEYTDSDFLEDVSDNLAKLSKELLAIKENNDYDLDTFFINLYKNKSNTKVYELYKKRCSILRLYAIKIDDGLYLITGGAIKIVKEMHNHLDTKSALEQLNFCTQFLQDENIKNTEQLQSFISFKNGNK